MSNQGSPNMGQTANGPYENQYNESQVMQNTSQMQNQINNSAVYPEVIYKLKPYITMTCDLISSFGITMPTQQQLEDMVDGIYKDFCKMNPDMADYMSDSGGNSDSSGDPPPFRGGFHEGFRDGFRPSLGFRRRGLGRDFIAALLLDELLGRGGYYY